MFTDAHNEKNNEKIDFRRRRSFFSFVFVPTKKLTLDFVWISLIWICPYTVALVSGGVGFLGKSGYG
jgi:hypothetical protein